MQQGDRVSFTMSCDDGPGTPVREEEREGIIVMLTKSTYLADIDRTVVIAAVRQDDGRVVPVPTHRIKEDT